MWTLPHFIGLMHRCGGNTEISSITSCFGARRMGMEGEG